MRLKRAAFYDREIRKLASRIGAIVGEFPKAPSAEPVRINLISSLHHAIEEHIFAVVDLHAHADAYDTVSWPIMFAEVHVGGRIYTNTLVVAEHLERDARLGHAKFRCGIARIQHQQSGGAHGKQLLHMSVSFVQRMPGSEHVPLNKLLETYGRAHGCATALPQL